VLLLLLFYNWPFFVEFLLLDQYSKSELFGIIGAGVYTGWTPLLSSVYRSPRDGHGGNLTESAGMGTIVADIQQRWNLLLWEIHGVRLKNVQPYGF